MKRGRLGAFGVSVEDGGTEPDVELDSQEIRELVGTSFLRSPSMTANSPSESQPPGNPVARGPGGIVIAPGDGTAQESSQQSETRRYVTPRVLSTPHNTNYSCHPALLRCLMLHTPP